MLTIAIADSIVAVTVSRVVLRLLAKLSKVFDKSSSDGCAALACLKCFGNAFKL